MLLTHHQKLKGHRLKTKSNKSLDKQKFPATKPLETMVLSEWSERGCLYTNMAILECQKLSHFTVLFTVVLYY